MDGPARREAGDEALFLTLRFNDEKEAKALVDTGASDCFMSKFCKDQIPKECIQDSWTVKKGEISLADNSSQNILTSQMQIFYSGIHCLLRLQRSGQSLSLGGNRKKPLNSTKIRFSVARRKGGSILR